MNNQKNIFINSGIRSKFNQGFLQPKYLKILGYSLGYILAEEYEVSCPILIATDTRPSGQIIKDALVQGLLEFGHDVFDAGICPTPFVAKALKDYQPNEDEIEEASQDDENFFTLGIVITASHNPAEYNGIKILTPFGYLSTEIEEEISEIFHQFLQNPNVISTLLADEPGLVINFDLRSWYQSEIVQDIENTPFNTSIVIDCAHGATAQIAPAIFQACGFNVIAINNSLDGTKINQNSGCTQHELLKQAIQQHDTQWGCAFDGDGDRIIIANKNGTIFDGDDIVAVLAQHQRYNTTSTIVGTIVSNQALDTYLQQLNKKLLRVDVGERNLIQALIEQQAFLGAESCGHVTMMDHAFCSDGIFAALMFFDTLATNKKFADILYNKHTQLHATVPLENKTITENQIKEIVTEYSVNTETRIIVRRSNTEPILRILVEDTDPKNAERIIKILEKKFLDTLQ